MISIEKRMIKNCIISIILAIFACFVNQSTQTAILLILIYIYFDFFLAVVILMYNRRKIVEESKCPVVILIIGVYLTNIINLSLIAWVLHLINEKSFRGINSYIDAIYYIIATFSTVGYGDITPATSNAKIVSIAIIASNFLLLLVFLNLFVMKIRKKEDYLGIVMFQICFLFQEMSSCCGIIDKTYKEKSMSWRAWIDVFTELLDEVLIDNPEKVCEREKERKEIYNEYSSGSSNEETRERPNYYINGKDQLLIEKFTESCNKVVDSIDFLESNRIILLENENLSQALFFTLRDIKEGFKYSAEQYKYGIKNGNDMLKAFKNDLYIYLEELGYQAFNKVNIKGYGFKDNLELTYSLMRIDSNDRNTIFWFKVRSLAEIFLRI